MDIQAADASQSPAQDAVVQVSSARDSGRFETPLLVLDAHGVLAGIGPQARRFFHDRVEGSALVDLLEEVAAPHGLLALRCVLTRPSFRRGEGRLTALHGALERARVELQGQLRARGLRGSELESRVAEGLHRLCRYAANFYAWRDRDELCPEQRAALCEDDLVHVALEVQTQRFTDAGLQALARRMSEVLRDGARSGRLKKARDETVLRWCRANIRRTSQRYRDAAGRPCFDEARLDALAEVKLRAVVFNILLDDLADDVQDRRLFELFRRIPFADDGRLAALSEVRRARLRRELEPAWRAYFDLAADSWNEFWHSLRLAVGAPALERFGEQLCADYELLVASMDYALELNDDPSAANLLRSDGAELLAHNMNMMAFETIDRMALVRSCPQLDARLAEDTALYQRLRAMAEHVQYNGQLGNSTTTLGAEIDENCLANVVFQLAVVRTGDTVPCELALRRQRALARGDVDTYRDLGGRMAAWVEASGAQGACSRQWVERREAIEELAQLGDAAVRGVLDVEAMLAGNDMLLAASWICGGDI